MAHKKLNMKTTQICFPDGKCKQNIHTSTLIL